MDEALPDRSGGASASLVFAPGPAWVPDPSSLYVDVELGGRPPVEADHASFTHAEEYPVNPELLYHGPAGAQRQRIIIDVGKRSTKRGEEVPVAWDANGKLTEGFLMKGADYQEATISEQRNFTATTSLTNTNVTLRDAPIDKTNTPVDLFDNVRSLENDARRLHEGHTQQDSRMNLTEFFSKQLGSDEKIKAQLSCKAIINAPSSSADFLGDSMIVLTQINNGKDTCRRIYFVQSTEQKEFYAQELVNSSSRKCEACGNCTVLQSTYDHSDTNLQYVLQNVSHMEVIVVEDQLLQVYCEQVDGTRVKKDYMMEKTSLVQEACCAQLCRACFKCLTCECLKCCRFDCCHFDCCRCFSERTVAKSSEYEIQARTWKGLEKLIKSESKMSTFKKHKPFEEEGHDYQTSVTKTNYSALHIRYRNPTNGLMKETVAILGDNEALPNAFHFVGLCSKAPNLLQSLPETTFQQLAMKPRSTFFDDIRSRANFIDEESESTIKKGATGLRAVLLFVLQTTFWPLSSFCWSSKKKGASSKSKKKSSFGARFLCAYGGCCVCVTIVVAIIIIVSVAIGSRPVNSIKTSSSSGSGSSGSGSSGSSSASACSSASYSSSSSTYSSSSSLSPDCSASSTSSSGIAKWTCSSGTLRRLSYSSNERMSGIIAPSGASSVTLTVSLFSTKSGCDKLSVWSCATSACSSSSRTVLLDPLSGSSLPRSVTSTTGIMQVEWTSNDASQSSGWTASWTSILKN